MCNMLQVALMYSNKESAHKFFLQISVFLKPEYNSCCLLGNVLDEEGK